MHRSADIGKALIKCKMRHQITAWLQLSFHHVSIQVAQHDILCRHMIIFHTARFDGDDSHVTINSGYISPGKGDQSVLGKQEIRLQHTLL